MESFESFTPESLESFTPESSMFLCKCLSPMNNGVLCFVLYFSHSWLSPSHTQGRHTPLKYIWHSFFTSASARAINYSNRPYTLHPKTHGRISTIPRVKCDVHSKTEIKHKSFGMSHHSILKKNEGRGKSIWWHVQRTRQSCACARVKNNIHNSWYMDILSAERINYDILVFIMWR